MWPIRWLNGMHVVIGRGWVLAKWRNSGGPQMKETKCTSERGSARTMALVQRHQWWQTKCCSGSFLCYGIEGFFNFFPWLSTGASSPSFLSLVSFCVFFFETPEWNFVSPNGVIDRALGFFFYAMEGGEAIAEEEERGGGQGWGGGFLLL